MWNESKDGGAACTPKRTASNPGKYKKRSFLLYIRIKLRGIRPSLNLLLPVALFVPHQLMLAWAGLLSLIPGDFGRKIRLGADTIHGMLLLLMRAQPQKIADIDLRDKNQHVRVLVGTAGFCGGEDI